MLTMAVILAILSAWVELRFVRHIPILNHLMEHGLGPIDAALINLVFSIAISVGLGMLFGVNGLIGFMGGLGSTAITNFYYPHEQDVKKLGQWFHDLPVKTAALTAKAKKNWADFRQPIIDFAKMVLWFLRVITTPVRWLRTASVWYSNRRSTASSIP